MSDRKDFLKVLFGSGYGDLFLGREVFQPGDQPGGEQFTNWNIASDLAFSILQEVMGDLYNSLGAGPLYINSVARAIGNLALVSPIGSVGDTFWFRYHVPAGVSTFKLPFQINSLLTLSSDGESSIAAGGYQADRQSLSAAGDFFVSGRTFYTFSPTSGGWIVYQAVLTEEDVPSISGFGLIPCLDQVADGTCCEVVWSGIGVDGANEYTISLPPITHRRRGWDGDQDNYYTFKLAGVDNLPATQIAPLYNFPVNKLGVTVNVGELIPQGLVVLWNKNIGGGRPVAVDAQNRALGIKDLMFRYDSPTQLTVRVPDAGHLILTETATGYIFLEEASPANSDSYVLAIGVASLAAEVSNLARDFFSHKHGADDPTSQISHADLSNRFRVPSIDLVIPYYESAIPFNDHPQYLHRGGRQTDPANGDNQLEGDLLIAPSNIRNGGYRRVYADEAARLATDSLKLIFGSYSTGPSFFYSPGYGLVFDWGRATFSTSDSLTSLIIFRNMDGNNLTLTAYPTAQLINDHPAPASDVYGKLLNIDSYLRPIGLVGLNQTGIGHYLPIHAMVDITPYGLEGLNWTWPALRIRGRADIDEVSSIVHDRAFWNQDGVLTVGPPHNVNVPVFGAAHVARRRNLTFDIRCQTSINVIMSQVVQFDLDMTGLGYSNDFVGIGDLDSIANIHLYVRRDAANIVYHGSQCTVELLAPSRLRFSAQVPTTGQVFVRLSFEIAIQEVI